MILDEREPCLQRSEPGRSAWLPGAGAAMPVLNPERALLRHLCGVEGE